MIRLRRRRWDRIALGTVLTACIFVGGGVPPSSALYRTLPADTSVSASVLFVGDSHLRGVVGLLESRLVDRPAGLATTFNAFGGMGVDDSPYLASRIPLAIAAAAGFDVVVVGLGTNDVIDGQVTADMALHINRIMDAAGGAPVLWVTLAETMTARSAATQFNTDLRSALDEHPNLALIEFGAVWDQHPEYYESDGVHLSPSGQEAFSTAIADAIDDEVVG